MRIIVFSDSHGDVDTMVCAVHSENPGIMIHLGDHSSDALKLKNIFQNIPLYFVTGNNDYVFGNENEKLIDFDGVKVFISHGHKYHVKSGYMSILYKGLGIGADIVLFGHTHNPYIGGADGVRLMNPGTVSRKNFYSLRSTYGIININGSEIGLEIKETGKI